MLVNCNEYYTNIKKTTYLKLQIISSSDERMNLKLLTTDACVSSFADVTMDFFFKRSYDQNNVNHNRSCLPPNELEF